MNFEMKNNPSPHLDMYDLNANDPYEATKILLKIAKDKLDFTPYSEQGSEVAKELMVEIGEGYLNRTNSPTDLCKFLEILGSIDSWNPENNIKLIPLEPADPSEVLWKLHWEVHDDPNPTSVWSLDNDPKTRKEFELVLSRLKNQCSL